MSLIPVITGGKTRYLPDRREVTLTYDNNRIALVPFYQVPEIEGGEPCFAESEELERIVGYFEDDNEICNWTEYWELGELRHRSVNLILKRGLPIEGKQGELGG